MCTKISRAKLLIIFDTILDVSLRLQGPLSVNGIGRVEVFYDGQWGTICDNNWNIEDADVVCRKLGYYRAIRALTGYFVPSGTGPIWLNNVGCTGDEQTISSCYHSGWGVHNCGHDKDAGVECTFAGIILISLVSFSGDKLERKLLLLLGKGFGRDCSEKCQCMHNNQYVYKFNLCS